MKDDMKMRGFSHWTEESYLGKTKDIMKYFKKPMEEVEIEELRNFLLKYLREEKHQEARRRVTEANYNNMAKHKGIGVNEVSTSFSFYAPYAPGTENNLQPWGWFKTAQEAVAGTINYARAWDSDYVLIGHSACSFVEHGSYCGGGFTAGVLNSHVTSGGVYNSNGFRSVLVV